MQILDFDLEEGLNAAPQSMKFNIHGGRWDKGGCKEGGKAGSVQEGGAHRLCFSDGSQTLLEHRVCIGEIHADEFFNDALGLHGLAPALRAVNHH